MRTRSFAHSLHHKIVTVMNRIFCLRYSVFCAHCAHNYFQTCVYCFGIIMSSKKIANRSKLTVQTRSIRMNNNNNNNSHDKKKLKYVVENPLTLWVNVNWTQCILMKMLLLVDCIRVRERVFIEFNAPSSHVSGS